MSERHLEVKAHIGVDVIDRTDILVVNSVGTLELRSLIEPVRRLLSKFGGYYLEARAEDVDFEHQLVEVSGIHDSEGRRFYGKKHAFKACSLFYFRRDSLLTDGQPLTVPYDKLIIAVGSESMTHGVSGLEHCSYLKSISDARDIRRKVMENFEKASLPTTTDEERRQLLSFVICGGGKFYVY